MSSRLLVVVLLSTAVFQCSNEQFPVECMDDVSLQSRVCCPLAKDNTGVMAGRGTCTTLSLSLQTPGSDFTHTTVRDNWPYYYSQVCSCKGNYAGFDCSRCKYGHYGEDCSQTMVLPRRPVSDFTDSEWTDYIATLKMAKNYDSGYFVFLDEPNGTDVNLASLPKAVVKLYDLFTWQHHYAVKDNVNKERYADYAHEATGFPTWHRQLLLWLEWEIQYMIKDRVPARMDNYYTFRLHYWDWRREMQTNENSPFQSNRLGETRYVGGFPLVQGVLVSDGWAIRCWNLEPGLICNPNINTGRLQRCPFTGTELDPDPCNVDNPDWPTVADVKQAVQMSSYDDCDYNKYSENGFRNFMEGFNVSSNSSVNIASCAQNRLCVCEPGGSECTGSNETSPIIPIARVLHNSIHIILGRAHFDNKLEANKTGVMGDLPASTNDPIFINHHAMVDCILEEWLQRNPNTPYPQDPSIRQGHKENDYMIPFFPLVRQRDMFKIADNFGYSCNLPDASATVV